jgi:parallel beta-helix repeat protein
MYEQSSENVVAYNSVTHSGDGLFLWAGQSTMDTGEGGANDNLFYGNDFSHAPTNGIETTFSRNVFVNNRVEENWHGVWGGYSWQTQFIGNTFRNNAEAIAIEHGQDIRITGNSFDGDTTAIRLWWNRLEPSDWGYPKARDTRSRDYVILGNTFRNIRLAMRVENTQRVRVDGNFFHTVDSLTRLVGDTSGWRMQGASNSAAAAVPIPQRFQVKRLVGGINAMIPAGSARGRKTIIVDQWGPYDWQSPKLWPVGRSDASPQLLRVLGPKGAWRVVALDGVMSLSAETGQVGDTLTVVPTGGRENDWRVELEYIGGKVTTPFGEVVPAGKPVRLGWGRFIPRVEWRLSFRNLDSTAVIRATVADTSSITKEWLLGLPIAASLDTTRLDLTWYRPPMADIKQADLLTEAIGTLHLPAGRYRLGTIADDAIRVYLDGVLLLDDWAAGESHRKEVEFMASRAEHELRVVHLQKDGWYELRVDIEPVR